nr:MAG TPA: hypothetical protein [Bacteriophage sp.]DAV37439.1 MAG TPA: hypothetical protein [Caudoviricetes sp.]
MLLPIRENTGPFLVLAIKTFACHLSPRTFLVVTLTPAVVSALLKSTKDCLHA